MPQTLSNLSVMIRPAAAKDFAPHEWLFDSIDRPSYAVVMRRGVEEVQVVMSGSTYETCHQWAHVLAGWVGCPVFDKSGVTGRATVQELSPTKGN